MSSHKKQTTFCMCEIEFAAVFVKYPDMRKLKKSIFFCFCAELGENRLKTALFRTPLKIIDVKASPYSN